MFTKFFLNLSPLLLILLVSCSNDEPQQMVVGSELYGSYWFDDCIVKVEIDKHKTLSYESYHELNRFIVPGALLHAFKSGSYPLFQTDTTRSSAREYYFFFAALCEDKLKYTDSIVKKHFLAKRKYVGVPYSVASITSKELPEGVGGIRGLWIDR